MLPTDTKKLDAAEYQLKDQVVAINRVTKVVKGGNNLSFAALVVVGDPTAGVVGFGSGKAKEVPMAIRKGIESAKKNLVKVNMTHTTLPHISLGIQNVLPKSIGTTNPHNVIKATFDALVHLRDRQEVATLRGKTVEEL